jgi:hypothetical protein
VIHPTSSDAERALFSAFEKLNEALHGRHPLPVRLSHRLAATVSDVLATAVLVRELDVAALRQFQTNPFFSSPGPHSEADHRRFVDYIREHGAEDLLRSNQFGAALKALFFFVRALQDSCYAAYLLSTGVYNPRAALHGKNLVPGKPLRDALEAGVSGYVPWFENFRRLRNDMKEGVQVGFGTHSLAPATLQLIVHEARDNPPESNQKEAVTIQDADRAISHSTRFLKFTTMRLVSAARSVSPP